MKLPSLLSPSAATAGHFVYLSLVLTSLAQHVVAVTFTSVPSANLDLSNLGRVGLVGDFDGISLYQYEGQTQNGRSTNGSQSVLARLPNGGFTSVATADASIMAMCNFVMQDGTMAGVIVGGNFTSLGGIESQAIALLNPNTSAVTPLTGISGKVAAILCDEDTNTVYVGGSFSAANSTNAIAWVGTAGWANLPFQGFNGPVKSITKAENGHIIFGGSFTGLGNASAPVTPDAQIINIANATLSSTSTTSTTGFDDPANIVCKTSGTDGAGNTWLLEDNTAGSWSATFGFGFSPTKLRLWNTHQDGRGTKTWRFTAMPINGIMNFTYTDPDTGLNNSCTSECPLSSSTSVKYQDFHFVNVIGMNEFRVDISAFYGSGGGLNGIELFQDNINAYAINSFNEPTCASISISSSATKTGSWAVSPSYGSSSEYLQVNLTEGYDAADNQVIFMPDIKQSGNYTVNMYTPGCVQDGTCTTRQQVNVTGIMATGSTFQITLYQSNNFDKYDQIYSGYIAAGTESFRPSVTLQPISGQSGEVTVVAQRVGFFLDSPAQGGLNSIFEWDPSLATVNTSDFSTSVFDLAGESIGTDGGVMAMESSSSLTFVGGNFSTTAYDNIFAINSTGTLALTGGGLNGPVMALLLNGTTLYAAGNFTSTSKTQTTGLNNVAAYDTTSNSWSALGAGVNGRVVDIVPISMNITANTPETVITITGNFNQIEAFTGNKAVSVSGFAIWVPSQKNWLSNINATTQLISGQLTTSLPVAFSNGQTLLAGSLSSAQLSASGAVQLSTGISSFPISIEDATTSSSTLAKRSTANTTIPGVVTGLFDETGSRNLTILGGHFSATATNGSTISNIAIINGSNSNTITGVGSGLSTSSTVLAMAVQNNTLFAGGTLSGTINGNTVNGIISYSLTDNDFPTQPPALQGSSVAVNSIAVRPDTSDIYFGGNYNNAGSLSCPAVCVFNTQSAQWNRPGTTLSGVANSLIWASATSLLVGGQLTISGSNTSLAQFDQSTSTWTAFSGASNIPGPITTMTAANSASSQLWVAGTATNGSTFLMMYDGTNWNPVTPSLGSSSQIQGLQVFTLTTNHASTSLVPADQALMLTGTIDVPGYGNASAVLYNGTAFTPFALTTSSSGSGSLSQVFTQQQNFFSSPGGHLALGFIVLIGLGIALGLIFLTVIAGILLARYRRRQEGYMPAPTSMFDKSSQMARLPPDQIFGNVGTGRTPGAPVI